MMYKLICTAMVGILLTGCCNKTMEQSPVTQETILKTEETILCSNPNADTLLLRKGLNHAAALWRTEDGTKEDFSEFAQAYYVADDFLRETLFNKISTAMEVLYGTANQATTMLSFPVVLDGSDITPIDFILGAFNPSAHLYDDLYANKVAFITALNFPPYSLAEKNELGKTWSRREWAYARLGDLYSARIPATLNQEASKIYSDVENYIAAYNIYMGNLLTEEGETLFPNDMVLLSHWNLRDEIKSNYANLPRAFEKQEMIYKVMERIVSQEIPEKVINNPDYTWKPYSNKAYKEGNEVTLTPEGSARYAHILNCFHLMKKQDQYYDNSTGITRNFEDDMEVAAEEIENLFINLIASPEVKAVAGIIRERLGRELRPYDIWYDGFKTRSAFSGDDLTRETRRRYPTTDAFQKDMPRMLQKLGFTKEKAQYLASHIVVEDARGSGHAAGAASRWEPARLRTRMGDNGMDYKGYNIAVHEFGHNVEQTLSLYDVDYYMMNGVPNTAFTEALAFVFQKRDLMLMGYPQKIDDQTTLDIFWGMYEIMGVSLVDMYTWRWLYDNPDATAEKLRDAVISIAKEVWNKYYEPVLGTKDAPLLAIYSHMVNAPMYLPNYPFGHIIEYQLEEYFSTLPSQKAFANEIQRIYTLGRLTPQNWMQQAVGSPVSTDPIRKAVAKIIAK